MRKLKRYVSLFFTAIAAIAFIEQLRRPVDERDWHGDICGIPYDFRPPTPARVVERWWNPNDTRLLTPHVFGVGWSINLYRLREILMQSARNGDG